MNKKYTNIIQIVTSLIISYFLFGCYAEKQNILIKCNEQCLTMENEQIKASFNSEIILVEQEYEIILSSKQKITSIYISGVNMNMGKLPLIITQTKNANTNGNDLYTYQTSFLLGLCSEPKMLWRLTVETEQAKNEFEFTSYWKQPII